MIKKILLIGAFTSLAAVLVFGAIYRTQAKDSSGSGALNDRSADYEGAGSQTAGSGYRAGEQNHDSASSGELAELPAADPTGLSPAEAEALVFMREEEKLAHDVYLAFYDLWGLPIFQNIAASEQTHTTSIKTLLDRYGLDDPASEQAGVFTNPDLQALYTELVAQGSQSLVEALRAGGAIEEIDILDLQARLDQTDNADVAQVFNSLLNGSWNHLSAFANLYANRAGEAYQPQYLSAADYQAIVTSNSTGSANGGRGNGGRGSGGGRP